jgi:hypothetical protein
VAYRSPPRSPCRNSKFLFNERIGLKSPVSDMRGQSLLRPSEIANPVRNHLNFGITGALMRGGGGAATLAALPTPLGSTVTLFIPPAFAGPCAIPLIGTFPAAAEPALRANCANEAAGAAATTARIAMAIFVEVLDMAALQLTCRYGG